MKDKPEAVRDRVKRRKERIKEMGLKRVEVYVPEEGRQEIHEHAKFLRIKYGKKLPADEE